LDDDAEDLKNKVVPFQDGIVLKHNGNQATLSASGLGTAA